MPLQDRSQLLRSVQGVFLSGAALSHMMAPQIGTQSSRL